MADVKSELVTVTVPGVVLALTAEEARCLALVLYRGVANGSLYKLGIESIGRLLYEEVGIPSNFQWRQLASLED